MDITNRFRRRNFLLRLVVLVAMLSMLGRAQKTYMRSCDCEYTADGKCAYTLQLPISQTMSVGEMCSGKLSGEQLARIVSTETKVDQLEENVKSVARDTQQNGRILLDMQSKVIALQHSILTNESNEELTDVTTDMPKTDSPTSEELKNSIQEMQLKLDRQQDEIDSLSDNFRTVADATATVRSDYETLITGLEDVQSYIERLGNSYEEANVNIQNRQVEIAELRSMIDGMKSEGLLCKEKGLLVDGGKRYIPDSQINVSSSFNSNHGPSKARIYTSGSPGAWCPQEETGPSTSYAWLQFDLGSPKIVYGLVTRGRSDYSQWVESYKLQYTNDWTGDEGWSTFKDVVGFHQVFEGNRDMDSPKTHMLWEPIRARYIRFVPITGYDGGNKCLRADVIGCLDED